MIDHDEDGGFAEVMKWGDFIVLGALGLLIVMVTLFVILPQQTATTAIIAFSATFFGIFLSFELERRRKDQEEKDQFTRLVQAIKVENVINDGLLRAVVRETKPGIITVGSFQIETSQTAMSDPRFYRWADQSLIQITAAFRTDLVTFNNLLISYRDVVVGGRTFGKVPVEKAKIIAEANLERVRVLDGVLDEALSGQPIADTRVGEVSETLNKIIKRQTERLEELSRTQPEKDDSSEIASGSAG